MAKSPAQLLLQKEFLRLKRVPQSSDYLIYDLRDNNLFNWDVYLFGPDGTCYEGGVFRCLMRFPENFPHTPPSLQFVTPIFHPNVFRDGKICISTLQLPHPGASAEESKLCWSAVLGVSGALQSVVSLLADPNPGDPAHPEAAALMLNDNAAFETRARDSAVSSARDVPDDAVRPVVVEPMSMDQRASEGLRPPIITNAIKQPPRVRDDDEESYDYGSDDLAEMDTGEDGAPG